MHLVVIRKVMHPRYGGFWTNSWLGLEKDSNSGVFVGSIFQGRIRRGGRSSISPGHNPTYGVWDGNSDA